MVLPASRRIPRVLRYSGYGLSLPLFVYGALTRSGRPFHACLTKLPDPYCRPATPRGMPRGLGSFPFARRYLGNRSFFLFLRVLRCFSSPGPPDMTMDSSCRDRTSFCRVSTFGYLRVLACLRLTVAFRSLPRPSSALGAWASTLCSSSLDYPETNLLILTRNAFLHPRFAYLSTPVDWPLSKTFQGLSTF